MTAYRVIMRSLQGSHLESALCRSAAASIPDTTLGSRITPLQQPAGLNSGQHAQPAHLCCLLAQPPPSQQHANLSRLASRGLAYPSLTCTFSSQTGGARHSSSYDEQLADKTKTAVTAGPPIQSSPTSRIDDSSEDQSQLHTDSDFVYHAPLSHTLLRLKRLSLFSCFAGLMSGPVIVALDSSTAVGGKIGIGALVASFGVFTSVLLHWFTSPYIHKLRYNQAAQQLSTDRLSFLARPVHNTFPLSAVQFADSLRPQTTFSVQGELFYVDKDHFGNDELYKHLDQPDPNAPLPPADGVADETKSPTTGQHRS